ncbi:MAG TPA: PQQ-dependent dehydrogenase, methanol/ethanol family [Vicinamibacterales bacterium]|nr:PQQ-dependent dehydrogenase, methanol/ethanol family [Vicinamibacterales bacterium]
MVKATLTGITLTLAVSTVLVAQGRLVDDIALRKAGTGDDWLTYGLSQSEARFSRLAQINTRTVDRLVPVWTAELGSGGGGQEATPLVLNGTLYVITNWSVVIAIDARTGFERWRTDPQVDQLDVRPEICCGIVNRGLATYKGLIIAPVIDGRLRALDAETGALVWESRVAFPHDHYTITMAPRIAKGLVIVGVSGSDRPTRGFFDAYDAVTGRRKWRFYTVPGDPSKPFENEALKRAASTWDNEWWTRGGGGAVWDGMAYDPDLGLVYVGTGNAMPWTFRLRSSLGKDNLYVASILAVDVGTGALKWHYQVVPGDNWDFDSVQHLILADLRIGGRLRKVVMQANKNGFYYVLDRVDGRFISAAPFSQVNWARGINPSTGRPIVNEEAYYGTDAILLSPGAGGAHNWSPMSFNPTTGLVYIPTSSASSFSYAAEAFYNPQPGRTTGIVLPAPVPRRPSPPAIGPVPVDGPPGRGALVAWDPIRQRMRWRMPGGGSIGGGTLSTAGNLVFQSLSNGRLVAYSADSGEKLLELDTGLRSGMGPPITYRLDGRQFVAVLGGVGEFFTSPGNPNAPPTPKLITFALAERYAVPRAATR